MVYMLDVCSFDELYILDLEQILGGKRKKERKNFAIVDCILTICSALNINISIQNRVLKPRNVKARHNPCTTVLSKLVFHLSVFPFVGFKSIPEFYIIIGFVLFSSL